MFALPNLFIREETSLSCARLRLFAVCAMDNLALSIKIGTCANVSIVNASFKNDPLSTIILPLVSLTGASASADL